MEEELFECEACGPQVKAMREHREWLAAKLNETFAELAAARADRDALAAECAAMGARNLATSYDRDAQADALRAEVARLTRALAEVTKERDALVALQRAAAEIVGASPGVLAHSCSGVAFCLACGKVAADWRAALEEARAEHAVLVFERNGAREQKETAILRWQAAESEVSRLRGQVEGAWRAGVEAAAQRAEAEEELDGPMPEAVRLMAQRDPCGMLRGAVRATKKGIAAGIRSLPPPSAPADDTDTNHKEK